MAGPGPKSERPEGFAPRVGEQIGFYVYLLIDPDGGDVFYVGKGVGNRCFAHLKEARKTEADSARDYPKLARIRAIEEAGNEIRIEILRHGLTESEAFLLESAAIDLASLLGVPDNRVRGRNTDAFGRRSVADLNAQYGATPVGIDPAHRVALIRINRRFERGMTDDELYEATRAWWRIGSRSRNLGAATAPEWAFAVYGGVVRAVYRIDGWESWTDDGAPEHANRNGRWAFRGTRNRRMEEIYLNGDVSEYFGVSQNPVRYVNCGRGLQGRTSQ